MEIEKPHSGSVFEASIEWLLENMALQCYMNHVLKTHITCMFFPLTQMHARLLLNVSQCDHSHVFLSVTSESCSVVTVSPKTLPLYFVRGFFSSTSIVFSVLLPFFYLLIFLKLQCGWTLRATIVYSCFAGGFANFCVSNLQPPMEVMCYC